MTDWFVRWNRFYVAAFFQFTIMVLAVSAVLDIVQIVAGLLAEESELLGACHVELLLATGLVALHARSYS